MRRLRLGLRGPPRTALAGRQRVHLRGGRAALPALQFSPRMARCRGFQVASGRTSARTVGGTDRLFRPRLLQSCAKPHIRTSRPTLSTMSPVVMTIRNTRSMAAAHFPIGAKDVGRPRDSQSSGSRPPGLSEPDAVALANTHRCAGTKCSVRASVPMPWPPAPRMVVLIRAHASSLRFLASVKAVCVLSPRLLNGSRIDVFRRTLPVITARLVAFICDENANCAPAFL